MGPEVALVEDLFDLKERIHALVEATGTLIEIFSVVVEGQTGMHEVLAFEANFSVFCHGLADAVQYLRLLPDVLYDWIGPFRGQVLLDSEPFLSGHLHFANLIILTIYKSRYAFSYRNSQNNVNNIYTPYYVALKELPPTRPHVVFLRTSEFPFGTYRPSSWPSHQVKTAFFLRRASILSDDFSINN